MTIGINLDYFIENELPKKQYDLWETIICMLADNSYDVQISTKQKYSKSNVKKVDKIINDLNIRELISADPILWRK